MKKGLVSVTFRQLDCAEIIKLCVSEGLGYIEWGGDIHVPSGDTDKAKAVAAFCRDAGIVPVGYGSYYNAADDMSRFYPALNTAEALGADYVRIWAGRSREYDRLAEENIRFAVEEAVSRGIAVSLECHRGTMTEDPELAVMLAKSTGCKLHFQPNPDIDFEDNLHTLDIFSPYLCAIHVFAWERGDIRLPLSSHKEQWIKYARNAPDVPFLLEFVEGNKTDNLISDAQTLAEIAAAVD